MSSQQEFIIPDVEARVKDTGADSQDGISRKNESAKSQILRSKLEKSVRRYQAGTVPVQGTSHVYPLKLISRFDKLSFLQTQDDAVDQQKRQGVPGSANIEQQNDDSNCSELYPIGNEQDITQENDEFSQVLAENSDSNDSEILADLRKRPVVLPESESSEDGTSESADENDSSDFENSETLADDNERDPLSLSNQSLESGGTMLNKKDLNGNLLVPKARNAGAEAKNTVNLINQPASDEDNTCINLPGRFLQENQANSDDRNADLNTNRNISADLVNLPESITNNPNINASDQLLDGNQATDRISEIFYGLSSRESLSLNEIEVAMVGALYVVDTLNKERKALAEKLEMTTRRVQEFEQNLPFLNLDNLKASYSKRERLTQQCVKTEEELYHRINDIFLLRTAKFTDVNKYDVTADFLEEIKTLDSASFIKQLLKKMFKEEELVNRTSRGHNEKESICADRREQIVHWFAERVKAFPVHVQKSENENVLHVITLYCNGLDRKKENVQRLAQMQQSTGKKVSTPRKPQVKKKGVETTRKTKKSTKKPTKKTKQSAEYSGESDDFQQVESDGVLRQKRKRNVRK